MVAEITRVTKEKRCWSGGDVPARVRRAVRQRDGDRCQLAYPGCTGKYQELDHVAGLADTGTHRSQALTPDQLQCVCAHYHKIKTQARAMHGKGRYRRLPEPHPGLSGPPAPAGWRYGLWAG